MTDLEYEVLDELYFVQSYSQLSQSTDVAEEKLFAVLKDLLKNHWIKCLKSPEEEVFDEDLNFEKYYKHYYYLATKKGLMAHNSL
ncbi:hypothetical protein [Xanthovirga aplysinae]|uniref:hypothetical protein n=1 Tax=Xanthovirga aplysinae TaxID=2529853 RepID=UPI0012BBB1A3|nr:hypothetical protein [Xanthovirga aplysinae]MTI32783.1 hypothetical protein [Xanthovirga aplysinae]